MTDFSILGLFVVLAVALLGGVVARSLKFQPVVGYIVFGTLTKFLFPSLELNITRLAELGAILLLFSIGLELSLSRFSGMIKKIVFVSVLEIFLVSLFCFLILKLFGVNNVMSLILAMGFSLSSTAVVSKMLFDNGELETVHGKLMLGWLLVQDLAVVPMMVILPVLANSGDNLFGSALLALLKAAVTVIVTLLLGRIIVPFLLHKVAALNSRELVVLTSVGLAIGTALGVSAFGISPALGAFLAGLVISESQENHAVFAETRPLRDLFVALFFVTLGFFVNPDILVSNFGLILTISFLVLLLKIVISAGLAMGAGFRGKTVVSSAMGLSQVGEFAFVIFSVSGGLHILSVKASSIGIAASMLTLIATPFIYKAYPAVWRFLSKRFKIFSSAEKNTKSVEMENHIIICGYGRVGSWVGKALNGLNVSILVIDSNRDTVSKLNRSGVMAIYGDASEVDVLDFANIKAAKAIIVAVPDLISQEAIVTHVQTIAPNVKIISRVHQDNDWEKMRYLKVDKLVQPEFEASLAIVRSILISMGKSKEEIASNIKSLKQSHAKI